MNTHKIWLIARREYLFNIRRRMYLFTVFVLPIISIGLSVLTSSLANKQIADSGTFNHIGIVDQTPTHLMSGLRLQPPYQLIDSASASTQLAAGIVDLYYVLPANYLSSGQISSYSRVSVPIGRDDDFTALVRQALVVGVPDQVLAARLEKPLDTLKLRRPGDPQSYDESVLFSAFLVPFVFGFALFMSVNTTSQYLMSGVTEEKETRMMELFITSSRPSEMLWGKLLGLGALGLTQIIVWTLLAVGFSSITHAFDLGNLLANMQITPTLLLTMLVYFVFGYLLYGALMAGIGVTANAEQDSRQVAGIITLISVLPFILLFTLISSPDSPLPVVLSLFPLTAPLTMIMRLGFGPVPSLQIVLSLVILIASALLTVWLSARLFRIGMLSYGKRLGLIEGLRAVRNNRQVIHAQSPLEKESQL